MKKVSIFAIFILLPLLFSFARVQPTSATVVVQLDATDLALLNGDAVAAWGGQTAAGSPTYLTNQTPNGGPAVQFNGSDRLGDNVPLSHSAAGDWIVAAVIKPDNIGAYHNLVDDDASNRPMLWIDPSYNYELNYSGGTGAKGAGTGSGGWDIVIADSQLNQLYVNSTTPNATGREPITFTAGESFDFLHRDAGQTFQGLVAEPRIYNDRAAFGSDFAALHDELATKWIAPPSPSPLDDGGWELVAHMSNIGGMFDGNGDLLPNYAYGTFDPNPVPSTPDFQRAFPVAADKILFITGDLSVWGIADYGELRTLIDAVGGSQAANLDFEIGVDGVNSNTMGNVLSRSGVTEDPWISIDHDHGIAITNQRIVWGENNYPGAHRALKNNHGGINVYVKSNQAQTTPCGPFVPEAANYDLVYTLPIPTNADYNNGLPPYSVDNSASIGSFDRVAYCVELDSEWIWVSLDAFTTVPAQVGVPVISTGAVFQQQVSNMNVDSNVPGIVTGTGISTGNIEFWHNCYSTGNEIGIPGASSGAYDFGDNNSHTVSCYGSMQLHNYAAGQTLFAYNSWDQGQADDLGIGNHTGSNPDWTFAHNAGSYGVRNMYILVGGSVVLDGDGDGVPDDEDDFPNDPDRTVACDPGYYGATDCTPAPMGTYVGVAGALTATSCPEGTFSDQLASTACTPAPIGFYVGIVGAIEATACSLGETTASTGSISSSDCTEPPSAVSGGTYSGNEGSPIALDGSGSTDDDGITTYEWDCENDGTYEISSGSPTGSSCTYGDNGSFTVSLRVTDTKGVTGEDTAGLTVDNVAPTAETLAPTTPNPVVEINTLVDFNATFSDPAEIADESYTCSFDWDGDGTEDDAVPASYGACSGTGSYATPGVYTVMLTVKDDELAVSNTIKYEFVVVYDPTGGFVTGGGWIMSLEEACPDFCDGATGRANFGFVSKYKNGATTPTGSTNFQFKAGDLHFKSTSYEWLVIAGANAKYKGEGTINGAGSYGFMLTATDSDVQGGGPVDTFRIKIWDKNANDGVVYDNKMGAGDDGYDGTELGGGNIKIHKAKK